MDEYALRVFQLAKGETSIENSERLWLSSCASHTMNRFVRSLKRNVQFGDDSMLHIAVFCFSLLLNCVDLASQGIVFDLICRYFGSASEDNTFLSARQALLKLIEDRPKSKEVIDNIMSNFNLDNNALSTNTGKLITNLKTFNYIQLYSY